MYQQSRGIVLSSMKYSEYDIITRIYSRDFGLISFLVKGATSKKNNKQAYFQPLTIVDFVYNRNEKRGLQYLKEISIAHKTNNIRFDVIKSTLAIFCAEIIQKSITEQESNSELYDFVEENILKLDETPDSLKLFPIEFMINMSGKLGFKPEPTSLPFPFFFDMEGGVFSAKPSHSNFLNEIDSLNINNLLKHSLGFTLQVNIDHQSRARLLEVLIEYYKMHLHGMPRVNSLEILSEVFK